LSGNKKTNYVYKNVRERVKTEWVIFALAYVFVIIAEMIGRKDFKIGAGMFILFPIFYAIILGIISGPHVARIIKEKHVKAASGLVIIGICPFIAKLGITAGSNIDIIIKTGPILLFHGFGSLLCIFLAMPVAILLGMKREAVGACFSLNREYHMALINEKYGPDSFEARGSLSVYIVGGMIGTIYFGFLATLVSMTGLFTPEALGLGSGVGAGIMMASSSAALSAIYPDKAETIKTLASAGETIAGITGIYMYMFIGIPLCNKMYTILEPKLSRFSLKKDF